jgi:uncharacterized damage-inducible protein DinB
MFAGRPVRSEAADYYFTYIDKVDGEDICAYLRAQRDQVMARLAMVSAEQSGHRYAPGKWSIKEVVSHLNDAERLFAFRAFWFARGFDSALPSFDQDMAMGYAGAELRTWDSHVDEFRQVRASSLALLDNLPAEAWTRQGSASGYVFTVRALAFVIGGHVAHHLAILNQRYLTA